MVFKQAKDRVTSFCLFILGGCISRLVSDFTKADFGWFQKSVFGIVQTGL